MPSDNEGEGDRTTQVKTTQVKTTKGTKAYHLGFFCSLLKTKKVLNIKDITYLLISIDKVTQVYFKAFLRKHKRSKVYLSNFIGIKY